MIICKDILFSYPEGSFELDIPLLELGANEQVAVIGPSGTGKTTLLYLLAGIYQAQRGTVTINNLVLNQYSTMERQDFRIASMGLVFQEFELLEYLTVWDNILLPYYINSIMSKDSGLNDRATDLLEATGLIQWKNRYPNQLSQGERQRVAVCRALVTQPRVLLCDEPTGNLDPGNKDQVLQLLLSYSLEHEVPLILVTHDHQHLDQFSRIVDISELT